MVFLFDNHPLSIEPSVLEELKDENEKDVIANAAAQGRRTRKKKLKRPHLADDSKRKNLRRACRTFCENMKPSINRSAYVSPFIIEGDNQITYEMILNFMLLKKNIVLIKTETAHKYMQTIKKEVAEFDDEAIFDHDKIDVEVQQSESAYQGVRSAIGYVYKMACVRMPDYMVDHLRKFIAGKRRTGLKEKQHLGLKITEGKRAMSFEAYELIAKYLFHSGKKEHIFAHLFMVLDWNLMKRAENCVACKINHITFRNDSLVFEFAKSKGHQKGEKHVGPWHVYANPFKPWICPVLSMARYVFSFSDVLTGDMPLFEGNNQYARFMYCFEVALESLKAELTVLGYNKGDLGSHSCRKGVATWIAGALYS